MQTFAVIKFLDEKGKPNLNIFQGSVFPKVNFFDLERFEKAFRGSIVIGIPFAGHADPKAVLEEHVHLSVLSPGFDSCRQATWRLLNKFMDIGYALFLCVCLQI